jgi:membrane-associated phospholipid phosphatase
MQQASPVLRGRPHTSSGTPRLTFWELAPHLATVAVLLSLFVALAVVVRSGTLMVDTVVVGLLARGPVPLPLGILNIVAGAPVWTGVVLLIAAILIWRRFFRLAAWLVLANIAAEVASVVAKLVVARRVMDLDAGSETPTWWDGLSGAYLFPSGHVVRVMVVLGVLVAIVARTRPELRTSLWLGWVVALLLLGFARIDAHAHLPTDVLGGYLLGGALLYLTQIVGWGKTT